MTKWFIRECQECGHCQRAKDPATYTGPKELWRDVLCKKCGSPALDYGQWKVVGGKGDSDAKA
jgi:hypothetical protein